MSNDGEDGGSGSAAGLRLQTNGTRDGTAGFVAPRAKRSSVVPVRAYAVLDEEDELRAPERTPPGKYVEAVEIELLSDVEGSSELENVEYEVDRPEERWMQNIWSAPNRAVVMSYFCVGFGMRFLTTPISYYLVSDLDSEPQQQTMVFALASLPWSFKLFYGFLSDNFPIMGMRRKPYFIAGWAVFCAVNFIIAISGDPSVQLLAGGMFVSTAAFMLSDVVTDAILVERSKREPREKRGGMQAIGYSVRFVGSLLGSVLGMIVFNKDEWGWGLSIEECFVFNGIFPLLFIGPWIIPLRETRSADLEKVPVLDRIRTQSSDVFKTLEQRAVYIPMSVVYIYNVLQVPNAAWRSFLVDGLEFEPYEIGILGVIASLMSTCGLLSYKRWFFHISWRKIYVWTTLLVSFFGAIQLLLIFRINLKLGIPDIWFSIGDDSVADFVLMIQFLPIVQMYLSMCPDGAEGTTYAILTTLSNVAGAAAATLGTVFAKIWDVGNDTLRAKNFDGMWKLTLLTSLVQLLPLIFMKGLPANQAEQRMMQINSPRNKWGGIGLLVVLFGSLQWTIVQSILELQD